MSNGHFRKTLTDTSRRARYSNCRIYYNDKLLCINSEKKGRWYVEKTHAKILKLNEDGTLNSIQLTFKPKGMGYNDNDIFGLSEQKTQCVVTGNTDINILTRHHIIPTCYKKHLPEAYKSKNHHDVVFIAEDKHDEYERLSIPFRDYLHRLYGVPTEQEILKEYRKKFNKIIKKDILPLRTIIHSLYRNTPLDTNTKVKYEIIVIFNIEKLFNVKINIITIEWLELLLEYIDKNIFEIKNKLFKNPFKVLVDAVTDYDEFIKLWRVHFIETCSPQFLPIGWDINSKTKIELNK